MCKEQKFYICERCGNLVGMIHDAGVKMMCCGKFMNEIVANTVDASTEKHIPVVNVEKNIVQVKVGSVEHPMTQDHYIGWVYISSEKGGQRKCLDINNQPIVDFALTEDDKVLGVYAYCNLHGLWKYNLN